MRKLLVWSLPMVLLPAVLPWGLIRAEPPQQGSSTDIPAHGHAVHFWFGHPGMAAEVTRTVPITATEFRFQPGTVNVKVGETIRFNITNGGKIQHEFVIGDLAEQMAHDKEMAAMPDMTMDDDANGVSIAAGKTATLIWTFTRAGNLQYACHIPGHYAAGMAGQLIVHA